MRCTPATALALAAALLMTPPSASAWAQNAEGPHAAGQYAAAAPVAPAPMPVQSISYGANPLQSIDFHPARSDFPSERPLIVFFHGGAWVSGDKSDSTGPAKIRHYTDSGYHFATINYRLLPEVAIMDQAADVAAAVATLIGEASRLKIDRSHIVLMGHSAGAHLAALASTDPTYLAEAGLTLNDVAGTVLIDAAALDVPAQIRDAGPLLGFGYELAFGNTPSQQRALSPAHHAEGPNVGSMLMLHVERDSARQARLLADALSRAGTPAQVEGFAGRGMKAHNEINNRLGRSDYPATAVVDAWLRNLFAG